MKKIFTLCVLTGIVIVSRSQAVLNEVYPQPANGYNEFFELYNENNSLEYLDNYTIVSYYEEAGGKTGFYILDMPNDSMAAHGFYVGASQNPFDIQQQTGLAANFSWNNMPAGGSLTKWENNGASYTSVSVPANLNDFFVRVLGGNGGVYHVFVYKNGILVNGIVGGINTSTVPAYIKSMPNLFVNMSGNSPDFTINFNKIPDNSLEYIPNSLGVNNGYYRSADGLCGDWLKSDQPGQHTPGVTNGTSSSSSSQLSIAAVISQYPSDPAKALLTYNITAAPASAFPAVVEVYADYGISGQWDINDSLIDTRTIASASAGAQYIILPSWDVAVIIVVKSATDCYNKNIAVGNYWSILPVNLVSFQGNMNKNNKVTLQWRVENNETTDQFEVQRSFDGKEFKTTGLVFGSEKTGTENYMFYETVAAEKVMYRLKMIDKQQNVNFSKVLVFRSAVSITSNIRITGNPVNDKLTFSYTTSSAETANVKVYDMTGKVMMNSKVNNLEGSNIVSLALSPTFKPGMYIVEVNNGTDRLTSKFIKQ